MNVERFHAIVLALRAEMDETEEPGLLGQLSNALRQSVQDPSQAAHQQELSDVRQRLDDVLEGAASNGFSPAWRQALEELGVADLLGERLRERLEAIFTRNEITPSAAANEIAEIEQGVQGFVSALNSAEAALDFFEIGSEQLDPGDFEIGFLIPREEVRDEFQELGQEFVRLKQLLGPFLELATGTRPEVRVRSISSSDFQVFLGSDPAVALMIATALERLIASYEKILNIRLAHQQLREQKVPDGALQGVSEHVSSMMTVDIDTLTDELLAESEIPDPGRANELRTELKRSLDAIAERIDRGYSMEVRAGELPEETEQDQDETTDAEVRRTTEAILSKQRALRFMKLSGKPILSLDEPDEAQQQEREQGDPDEEPAV